MSAVSEALPAPEMYYSTSGHNYFVENDSRRWISVTETSAKRMLKALGFSSSTPEGEMLSPLDEVLNKIQLSQDVSYAASLAGYSAGVYEISGKRILVTDSPTLIEPVEGEWPVLDSLLEGMFNLPEIDQRPYVYGWFKIMLESLRRKKHQQGQVLALAGEVESGKSLFQGVVTELLGGRVAHPYPFMVDKSTFNGELFAAEHLAIEDEAESTDYRSRRNFAAKIKGFVANRTQACHRKHCQPLTLTPFWRLTISLNEDPERIMVLPPINEDIEDKIMLLKVAKRAMPMATETGDEKEAFWNVIKNELPAFVFFLNQFEIPVELRSSRFGITHYHHPELLAALDALSPEERLLEMIDNEVLGKRYNNDVWRGNASSLFSCLTDDGSDCRQEALRLLSHSNSCGTYLGRLQKKYPDRVESRRINGTTEWIIQPREDMKPKQSPGVSPWMR